MGFRKEVREHMAEMSLLKKTMRDFIKTTLTQRNLYKEIMDRQKDEIQELRDRLYARDLPEFKQFQLTNLQEMETYNPESDLELAGESVEI